MINLYSFAIEDAAFCVILLLATTFAAVNYVTAVTASYTQISEGAKKLRLIGNQSRLFLMSWSKLP